MASHARSGLRHVIRPLTVALALTAGVSAQTQAVEKPIHLGHVTLIPRVFLDSIGEWRSASTNESVSTSFGNIPLNTTSGQWLSSLRHTRPMGYAIIKAGGAEFTTYIESDFMNFHPGQSPYRWRHYWERVRFGKWEVSGGLMWSLLRSGRHGIEPERDLMNTDVVEPNYHVGVAGARRRQVRLAYHSGAWHAAVAWEGTTGLWAAKVAHDQGMLHLEAGVFTGRHNERGFMTAQGWRVRPRVRLVSQQYVSRNALAEALSLVARGVSGSAAVVGAEVRVTPLTEFFSYGGLAYAERSSGNRLVRQYTVGASRVLSEMPFGSLQFSVQFSQVDRELWQPRSGSMSYAQARLRYTMN